MTRKQWVRQMPWQLAAAGAVAGALFGVSALYSASTAFADCGRGPGNCNQNAGRSNNGGNNGQGGSTTFVLPQQQPQHQQQTFQFTGHTQSNSGQNNGGQNGQTFNLQQWQGNQQQANQPKVNNQPPPAQNQNVQQFVQQLADKWQQPQQQTPPQVTVPAFVPPVPAFVPPVVVQQFVAPQIVVDPPPAPVVNVTNTTNRRRSNNSAPAPVVNVPTVADVVAAVTPLFTAPLKVDPPAPTFFNAAPKPVIPAFAGPVQQAAAVFAAAPAPVIPNAVGPNFFNNNPNDPWWWWWNHHQRQHNPPPPPPPPPPVVYVPPVVYQPQVFYRTVTSCASVQPYQQTTYPYGNLGVPYGYQGMPYGYNPNIFNQPVAPNYAPTYGFGQGSIYQQGYPYNLGNQYNVSYPGFNRTIFFNGGYPYGANNVYPYGINNGLYNNGYPFSNQYSNYDERVNTPRGILIIHHVLVACPQPVQQVYSVAVTQPPVTPSYQTVAAAPAPQVYAPVYQAQQSGFIAPPRTGDAGLIGQGKSSNAWLPDFVILGLLSLFSAGVMARARQR